MEGRHSFVERRYAVVHDLSDAATVLASRDPSRVITASCKAEPPAVAFMFPGQAPSTSEWVADSMPATRISR